MRIGILADIHGHLENLRSALASLQLADVDTTVVLGDLIETRAHAAETVALLKARNAVGVWGNHELGLCIDPPSAIRTAYTEPVVEYFGTLAARFELGDVMFSHTLPSQDATDPAAYYLGPHPHEGGALDECFARFPHRIMFVGHFHRWFAATRNATISWDGSEPIEFELSQRYLVVVHAVMNGWFAIFDDSTDVLTPIAITP